MSLGVGTLSDGSLVDRIVRGQRQRTATRADEDLAEELRQRVTR
jgi:hypothetical protein